MAGTITVYVDGMPLTIKDRIYSWDEPGKVVDPLAFKSLSASIDQREEVWRTQRSVRMVTGFIARNLAQVALHAFERDDNDDRLRVRDTPLALLLARPDRRTTPFEHMHALVMDLCKYDRYAAPLFANEDGTYSLVRLPPGQWDFERDSFHRPRLIRALRPDGSTYPLSLDRALWLDGFPSEDDTSPMAALIELLEEERAASSYRRDLLRNGGRFPGWLARPAGAPAWATPPAPGQSSARDKFKVAWRAFAQSGTRAGETPILEDGMEYHETEHGLTPDDAQQLESRKLTIAEVAAQFGIAAQLTGVIEGNYSNVDAYRELLYTDAFGPWFVQIQQAYNVRVAPIVGGAGEYAEFNVDEKMRMSFEAQARVLQTAVGGPWMLRNEARKIRNMRAVPGGDELITPLNVTEGGQASPTDSGSQNTK